MEEIKRLILELREANMRVTMARVRDMSSQDKERYAVTAAVTECKLKQAIRKEVGRFAN